MTHTFFSLILGPYDSDEAVATLPGQLELLRAYRDLGRPDTALVYRLETVPDPGGGMSAIFSMLCVGKTAGSLTSAEVGSIQDQAAVVLVPAWGLTHHDREPAVPRAKHRVRLRPKHGRGSRLPIKPDWAPLVDLLRRREDRVCIDLICTPVTGAIDPAPSTAHLDVHHHVDMGAVAQIQASQFFCAISVGADQPDQDSSLALSLVIHSDSELDRVFTSLVGRIALGIEVDPARVTRDILFPRSIEREAIVGSPETLLRAFHPPYGHIEGRGLDGMRHTSLPVRFRLPQGGGGIALGTAIRQGGRVDTAVPIDIDPVDRLKHVYVLGKTGSGKTNLLMNLVRQDIEAGHGVAVIDPHGPLVDHALRHVGDRVNEVTLLDFSDPDYLPKLNPLLLDTDGDPGAQALAIEELLDVLVRKTFNQFAGPVFEDTVRMMLASVISTDFEAHGPPSIPLAVELLRNAQARTWVAKVLKQDDVVAKQWENFNGMLPHTVAEHVRWVLAKFAEFGPDGALYSAMGAEKSPLSLNGIFQRGEILLVKIPESEVGSRAAGILGSVLFSRLHAVAVRSRGVDRQPFYVYVDEFQKFVDVEIEEMVAEARKFGLALTFAHQNTRQLDAFSRYEGTSSSRLREAIFSNVGTMICLRTSGNDVATVATELGVTERSVRNIRQYEALARPVLGGQERDAFVLRIPNAAEQTGSDRSASAVRDRMIGEGFWGPRGGLADQVDETCARLRASWTPPSPGRLVSGQPVEPGAKQSSSGFLDEWLEKRRSATRPGPDTAKRKKPGKAKNPETKVKKGSEVMKQRAASTKPSASNANDTAGELSTLAAER